MLTPGSIDTPPGKLSYVAPNEDGQDALVKLASVSKQGIGGLNLAFHTGAKSLKIAVTGTMTTAAAGVSFVTTVSIPSVVLTKQADGTFLGSGPVATTITIPVLDCPKPYTEKGTASFTATSEKVEDASLNSRWTVTFDPASRMSVAGTCVGVALGTFMGTGASGPTAGFMFVLGKIVIDENGGTYPTRTTVAVGASQNTIDAKVVGEVVSDAKP
jgi:hypothetical protein